MMERLNFDGAISPIEASRLQTCPAENCNYSVRRPDRREDAKLPRLAEEIRDAVD
jgi:hypothetical protein